MAIWETKRFCIDSETNGLIVSCQCAVTSWGSPAFPMAAPHLTKKGCQPTQQTSTNNLIILNI